jgi:hypothetical protein
MLRHLITHPATRFILQKMQPTTKDSTKTIIYPDKVLSFYCPYGALIC